MPHPCSGAVLRHPCLPGTSWQQGDLQAAPGTRRPRGCCHRNAPSSRLLAPHGTAGAQRVPPSQQRYITCKPSPEPGWCGQHPQPWCGRTRHSRGARKEVTAPGTAESPEKRGAKTLSPFCSGRGHQRGRCLRYPCLAPAPPEARDPTGCRQRRPQSRGRPRSNRQCFVQAPRHGGRRTALPLSHAGEATVPASRANAGHPVPGAAPWIPPQGLGTGGLSAPVGYVSGLDCSGPRGCAAWHGNWCGCSDGADSIPGSREGTAVTVTWGICQGQAGLGGDAKGRGEHGWGLRAHVASLSSDNGGVTQCR